MQSQKISLVVLLSTFLLFAGTISEAMAGGGGISVTPTDVANDLRDTIIGSGITPLGEATLTGGGNCVPNGTFSSGFAAIGIDSGILLTSGNAANVDDLNDEDDTTTDCDTPGNDMLDDLIPGFETFDAAILEFDFEFDGGEGGDLFFNYVFGSEEYNEFVDSSFNDVFGFFVDGVNIAFVPGSGGVPVAINNVNCGNPFNAAHPDDFCAAFYNNNDLDDGGPFFPFEYDGFTDVFTAELEGLGPGSHTMQIKIADAGDGVLDSGVFIEGGTFSSSPPTSVSIGGEIIPIQASALLIAGFTSNLALIGPIIAASAIGAYLIRKR